MRTTRQVAIYCVLRENNRDFYILVKRNEKRGGFWQPLTGGEEDFDNDIYQTVIREINEELGIDVARENILDISHSFKFEDKDGVERTEQCFSKLEQRALRE
ncbi:MAG: NUDIX domain-containing protein, partial [Patescibacteria group bacterium]